MTLDTPDAAVDELARAVASDVSRRRLLKLAGGAALASMLPAWSRPERAAAGTLGSAGTCAGTGEGGACGPNLIHAAWSEACGTEQLPGSFTIPSGKPSTYNGCGPQAGIDLGPLGKAEPPDSPLGLANFTAACNAHDCCYGRCGSQKSECDTAFIETMLSACDANAASGLLPALGALYCHDIAALYWAAVASGGADAYKSAQMDACNCCEDPCGECNKRALSNPAIGCCGEAHECVDTSTDPDNCGQCGRKCSEECSANQGCRCCKGICLPGGCSCPCDYPAECCEVEGAYTCCPNGCVITFKGTFICAS